MGWAPVAWLAWGCQAWACLGAAQAAKRQAVSDGDESLDQDSQCSQCLQCAAAAWVRRCFPCLYLPWKFASFLVQQRVFRLHGHFHSFWIGNMHVQVVYCTFVTLLVTRR